jgi:thiosulfate/3-mercaptopyruvate sulfurtransferase
MPSLRMVFLLAALPLGMAHEPATTAPDSILVTPAWLAQRMKQPGLVIFEVGEKPGYDAAHIPGAQFISLREIAAPRVEGALALELPPIAQLDSVLEAKGVSDNSDVVVYFGKDWVTPTTRVFLTLEYAGLRGHVAMLDGGLPAWQAAGNPVTTEVPVISKGSFTPHPRSDVVVDAAWVSGHLHDSSVAIIDARDSVFYLDIENNQMPRGGHIAGAKSIPFGSLAVSEEDNRLKSIQELRQLFVAAGAAPGDTVVSYCHIGQQGTFVFFAARLLGYDVRLYDGSFQDWSARKDLPVEGEKEHRSGTLQ